jgi:ABC-type nitrate/sulfonate/bicarbonate transport system substrate-binding protein
MVTPLTTPMEKLSAKTLVKKKYAFIHASSFVMLNRILKNNNIQPKAIVMDGNIM